MGIYDRDYYRREGPSFLGSFTERGTICKWLIGINVAAFIVQMLTRAVGIDEATGLPQVDEGWFTNAFILDVNLVLHGQVWRLFTYAFLHSTGDIWHLVFNMLFLWWFGSDVEDLYGAREFLSIYLVSVVAGGVVYVLSGLAGFPPPDPAGHWPRCLGASGAVTAVVVLCAIHYPTRVIYLFFLLPVPIWLLVVFWVARDAYTFLAGANTGTAVGVHLAGAGFSFAYYKLHLRLVDWWPNLRSWRRRLSQPRLRVYREEEEPKRPVSVAVTSPPEDEQLEAKVDAILEKISRTGKDSLTDGERELLVRASETIKRRRR